MLRNSLVIAFRVMRRDWSFSLMAISGMALGITCFMLIVAYVAGEVSYDRHFSTSDHLHRILLERNAVDGTNTIDATTPPALAPALVTNITGIESATRLFPPWGREAEVEIDGQTSFEPNVYRADEHFFEVFPFDFVNGDPETALAGQSGIVLKQETANRLFGTAEAFGQEVIVDGEPLIVTGVVADAGYPSHFEFDMLRRIKGDEDQNWSWWNFYTYAVFSEGYDAASLSEDFPRVLAGLFTDEAAPRVTIQSQPVVDIHLSSDLRWELGENGSSMMVTLFSVISLLVLMVACINFVSLTSARSGKRAVEIGLRQVFGSRKGQIARQFLVESMLYVMCAGIIGLGLLVMCLPLFNELTGAHLTAAGLVSGTTVLAFVGIVSMAGLLAGLWPAIVLPRLKARDALTSRSTSVSGSRMRDGLVFMQFVVACALVVASFSIETQLEFMHSKDLGFDAERVVVVPLRSAETKAGFANFRDVLLSVDGVEDVSSSSGIMGSLNWTAQVRRADQETRHSINYYLTSDRFIETLGLELLAGQGPIPGREADDSYTIINRSAAKTMGWTPEEAVGEFLMSGDNRFVVRGVVEDFHFRSFRYAVEPVLIFTDNSAPNYALVRSGGGDLNTLQADVQERWAGLFPGIPGSIQPLSSLFNDVHAEEARVGETVQWFAWFALVLSVYGLLGLVAISVESRRKELGIRKVLGATVSDLVVLLSRRYAWLLVAAFALGVPVALALVAKWLEQYVYSTTPGSTDVMIALSLIAGAAALTVLSQVTRVAVASPVDSIRK